MAGNAVIKRTNRLRDLIIFLDQSVDLCLFFKKKYTSGYSSVFFRETKVDRGWHEARKSGWSNALLRCVYDSILSGEKIIEVSSTGNMVTATTQTDRIKLNPKLEIISSGLPQNVDMAEKKIRVVMSRLEHGFLESTVVKRIIEDCDDFFSLRKQLLQKEIVFHLERSEIKDYLGRYYTLLNDLVQFYDSFDSKQDRDVMIGELLRIDTVWEEQGNGCQLDLWSPIALCKLQKVNEAIEVFFERLMEDEVAENEWMQKIYKHIFLIKAQHSFRWYVSGYNRKLFHVAIANYDDNPSNSLRLQVIARDLDQYNSYEGIGELRLGEKILHEYLLMKDMVNSEFCVVIMGDLHAKPLEELYRYVSQKLCTSQTDVVLKFHVYTKNELEPFETPNIDCLGYPAEVLLSREKLSSVIEKNHLVFILDCTELYRSPMPEQIDYTFVKQKYAFCNYDEYNYAIQKTDICDQNMLEELYEILTCEQTFNQFGMVTKQANASLLEFCEEKQREKERLSTVYIYVSDMDAFQNIYNDNQYYVRTERYHQKEIGIIRYSSEKVKPLKVGQRKDMILVFNIWQFMKNVAIDEKNMFFDKTPDSKDAYLDLDQIYIGIDYRDWPNQLVVHYFSKKSKYKPLAVKFIKSILLPIMNNHSRDMFNIYIRKAMYSFFFSAAKSVTDMLFIHLFKDKEKLLGETILAQENDAKWVCDNINIEFKFSSKRFYDLILKNYDMSSNLYVEQIRTSHIIQKNEADRTNLIYENVISACKNLSYDTGYLVKNCMREIEGRYRNGDL